MKRLRTKLLVAMLAVVVVTVGISAISTQRVTHQEVRRIVMGTPPQRFVTEQRQFGVLDRRILLVFAGATAAAIALTLLFSRRITMPIERLTQAVDAMARGKRPEHVGVAGRDEIARLATTFNAMADAIAEQESLRRRMVGDVAHELRTPLTNLRCELEAMQDGLATTNVASLHEEVVHLSRIVDDLQELAIADAGALQLRRETVDLAAVVVRSIDPFRGEAERRGIRITERLDHVEAVADPVRLGQIMRNLLRNALQHTPDGGRFDVAVTSGEIAVTNGGIPIPSSDLERIFERFYRVGEARSRNGGGAGLGLAIVQRLVELHGGRVWAENTADGPKFTFTISSSRRASVHA